VGFSPNFLPLGAITKIKMITIFATKKKGKMPSKEEKI